MGHIAILYIHLLENKIDTIININNFVVILKIEDRFSDSQLFDFYRIAAVEAHYWREFKPVSHLNCIY